MSNTIKAFRYWPLLVRHCWILKPLLLCLVPPNFIDVLLVKKVDVINVFLKGYWIPQTFMQHKNMENNLIDTTRAKIAQEPAISIVYTFVHKFYAGFCLKM